MNKVVYDVDRFIVDLDKFLKDKNMTQACFAKIMSYSESKVSRLLNGARPRINMYDLYKIAEIIGVSVDSYIIGEGYMFDVDICDMTIEEIDRMIEKLKTVRKEKIDAELAKLNAEQERLLRLKSVEE